MLINNFSKERTSTMKTRILSLLFALTLLFSLVSCNITDIFSKKDNTDPSDNAPVNVRVYTLNGTTGFGMAKLMEDAAAGAFATETYEFSVKTDASEVLTALANGSVDIAALPTNAASVIYNKTQGKVKMLAINTLGCLFLLNRGTSTVASVAELGGKTVYAPAQNPTFILTYLCKQNGLEVITSGVPSENQVLIDSTSYAQPANLRDAFVSKESNVELAVLPEPMVTIAETKAAAAQITLNQKLDLTTEWDKIPGKENTLVQGCVVVRTEFLEKNPGAVANFLKAYEESINYLNENVDDAANLVAKHGIFENANVAKRAIPKCNVKFVDGAEMKASAGAYLAIIKEINPNAIGGSVPADDFYYNANN